MNAETDSGEGRWMTYADLAGLRGIDKNSAARLTFRRHWRRQRDNHGTVRVFVPVDWLEPSRDVSRDVSDDASRDLSGDVSRDVSLVIKPLEDAIALLREQLERAEQRADRAESRVEQADERAGRGTAHRGRADAR